VTWSGGLSQLVGVDAAPIQRAEVIRVSSDLAVVVDDRAGPLRSHTSEVTMTTGARWTAWRFVTAFGLVSLLPISSMRVPGR